MTATDELRKMLDGCGIEHEDYAYVVPETQERCEITRVRDFTGRFKARFMSCNEPGKVDVACKLTPAQAIAATLGRGECENVGYYIDGTRFKCSSCDYNGWTNWAKDGEDRAPNYCPNCGRRVKR